jgi:photosystem II stability/assembly factor-like uncharacterized protein
MNKWEQWYKLIAHWSAFRIFKNKMWSFVKRLLLTYLVTTLILAGYIALHIPFSYLRDNPVGATTKISYRTDIYVTWLIAVVAALIFGRIRISRRWLRVILLIVSLPLIAVFVVSSAELIFRSTNPSSDWIAWISENAWIAAGIGRVIPSKLGEAFVSSNFTTHGILLSIVSIANTFRQLTWYWVVVPIIDHRYPSVDWIQITWLVLIFSTSLTLLGTAWAVVVSSLQQLNVSAYQLAMRANSVLKFIIYIFQQTSGALYKYLHKFLMRKWRKRSHTIDRDFWSFFKRVVLTYYWIFVLLVIFIALHIPFSYLRDDPVGATTKISYLTDIYVTWLIAVLAALILGRIRISRRWLRVILLIVSLPLIAVFVVSSAELIFRSTNPSSDWIAWISENAWIAAGIGRVIPSKLGEAFVSSNFTTHGILLSIVSIANTFRQLTWYWVVVPIFDPRYSPPGWMQVVWLILIFAASLTLLGTAVAIVVSSLQQLDASTYKLTTRVNDSLKEHLKITLRQREFDKLLKHFHDTWINQCQGGIQAISKRLYQYLSQAREVLYRLQNIPGWIWLQRGLIFLFAVILVSVGVGVLLTARLVEIQWNQVSTQGLPFAGFPSTEISIMSVIVGPDGNSLFASTSEGLFSSNNYGQNWELVSEWPFQDLAVEPDGSSIFAIMNEGPSQDRVTSLNVNDVLISSSIYCSNDGGQIWEHIKQMPVDAPAFHVAFGPSGKNLFVGTIGAGILRSDDNGVSWHPFNNGLEDYQVVSELSSKSNSGSLWAIGMGGQYSIETDENEVLGLSSDKSSELFVLYEGSETWRSVTSNLEEGPSAFEQWFDKNRLYVGTHRNIFVSSDDGQTWQPSQQGVADKLVQCIKVGPEGERLFAGTRYNGVFRSDFDGSTWQPVGPERENLYVTTLAVEPNRSRLFAGTWEKGLFYSDNNGDSWASLSNQVVSLTVNPDDGNLYVRLDDGGVFVSGDEGQTWQQSTSDIDFPENMEFGEIEAEIKDGRVYLNRQGKRQLPWATFDVSSPQAIEVHDSVATFYTMPSTGVLQRAEVPLPSIWNMPTPYVAMLAFTWRGLGWVAVNALPLSVGLVLMLAVISLYVYAGVARPNQLSLRTILWLLSRPVHLIAASGYRSYARRWAISDPLERLTLLRATPNTPFTLDQLASELRQAGAVFDPQGLRASLAALNERGLLQHENDAWILTEPLLAEVQRHELSSNELDRLAEQIRRQHPLYARVRDFFTQARFRMEELSAEEFLLTPQSQNHPQVAYGSVYTYLITGRAPTGEAFAAVCEAAQDQYGDDLSHRVALVISDRRPEPGARYRLYEIRQREGLAIVPLDISLFGQIKPNRSANDILASEIDQATGQQNLYAISGPVSGDLSFFGREQVLQQVIDLLNAGQPAGIFGLRKVGKTSLIQRLQGRLAQQRPIAMVDTQKSAQQRGIWSLYPDIIAAFADHLQRYRPKIALPDLHLWSEPGPPSPEMADVFVQDLRALHIAIGETDKDARLLLIVDEVDRLLPTSGTPGYEGFATLFGQLRAANQQARMLDFLVVGVDATVNRVERWRDRDNELYRALREVWMPPMEPDDVREMIESLGSQMGVRYEDDALDLLARCGGGQPFVTRQMCGRAVEGRLGRGAITVTPEQAKLAVEEFIFDDPYLGEMWRTRLDETQRGMLRQLAQASEPLPRLELLPASQRQEALAALSALEDYTLVRREGRRYTIVWEVFGKWIRWVELGLEE